MAMNNRKITVRIREKDYQLAKKLGRLRGTGHNAIIRQWAQQQADQERMALADKFELTQEDL
jgi:hypothetical protein